MSMRDRQTDRRTGWQTKETQSNRDRERKRERRRQPGGNVSVCDVCIHG